MRNGEGRSAVAGAFATLVASLTLVPLLQGGGWFVAVALVVGIVVGTGTAGRRLLPWPPAVVAVQVIVLIMTLTWLFVREVAIAGLVPGPEAVRAFDSLLQAGMAVTRQDAPPVETIRGVMLLACGGLGLVGLLVDVIAATLRRPAVAGLPLLAVYCVPAAVLPGGLSWWYFMLAAAGFLVLVGSDSIDRVRGWGRVLGPGGEDRDDRALGGPLAGARRLAFGCVLVAAVVPALVPGLGEHLIGNTDNGHGSGSGGNITVINPILKLRDNLNARSNVVVIRYQTNAPKPEPLRIVSDDVFSGATWAPSSPQIPRSNRVQDGLPSPPGMASDFPRTPLRTTLQTLDLRQSYLPLPYPPTKVTVQGRWIYDSATLNVVGDGVTSENLRYSVEHWNVQPTEAQLRNAPLRPPTALEPYLKLPNNLPRRIREIATQVAGTGSRYEQVLNLQRWLNSDGGFTYNTEVTQPNGRQDSGQDAVLSFLQNKQGYCVQFASAMAVMARTLNIPSRVAVGFLPGRPAKDGWWEVTVKDAHAWPELYFNGIGWVRFEPTPARRAGAPPSWAVPAQAPAPTETATVTAQAAPSLSAGPQQREQRGPDTAEEEQPPLLDRVLAAIPWQWLAAALLLVLLAGVPWAVERVVIRRRWRRAEAANARVRVETAWDELRERLEDLGVVWAASWTPRGIQARLGHDHALPPSAREALARLVTDLEHARYAPPDEAGRGVGELRSDVEAVVTGIADSPLMSSWMRRRARWFPLSGIRVVTGTLVRVDAAADRTGRRLSEVLRRRTARHGTPPAIPPTPRVPPVPPAEQREHEHVGG